jgi:hypothetical protein
MQFPFIKGRHQAQFTYEQETSEGKRKAFIFNKLNINSINAPGGVEIGFKGLYIRYIAITLLGESNRQEPSSSLDSLTDDSTLAFTLVSHSGFSSPLKAFMERTCVVALRRRKIDESEKGHTTMSDGKFHFNFFDLNCSYRH